MPTRPLAGAGDTGVAEPGPGKICLGCQTGDNVGVLVSQVVFTADVFHEVEQERLCRAAVTTRIVRI